MWMWMCMCLYLCLCANVFVRAWVNEFGGWWLSYFSTIWWTVFYVRHVYVCRGVYALAFRVHEWMWASWCKQINQNQSSQWCSVGTIAATAAAAFIFGNRMCNKYRKLRKSRHPYRARPEKSHNNNSSPRTKLCPFVVRIVVVIIISISFRFFCHMKIRICVCYKCPDVQFALWLHSLEFNE